MLPRENLFKMCNLVRFRVYFDTILTEICSKNVFCLYENYGKLKSCWLVARGLKGMIQGFLKKISGLIGVYLIQF